MKKKVLLVLSLSILSISATNVNTSNSGLSDEFVKFTNIEYGLSERWVSGFKNFFTQRLGYDLNDVLFIKNESNYTSKIIGSLIKDTTDEVSAVNKYKDLNALERDFNLFKQSTRFDQVRKGYEDLEKKLASYASLQTTKDSDFSLHIDIEFNDFHKKFSPQERAFFKAAEYGVEENKNNSDSTKPNFLSKLNFKTYYNSFWDKLKDNPRKSMGAIAALAGTALVFKKRSKIKKYFGNKIDSLKETYADVKDRYQELREMESEDIKELIKMELEEKLDDFKANYFNRNFLAKVTGVGIATAAAIALQKKYSLLQNSGQYAKSGLSWLDKNSVNYFQKSCDLAKNNPAIVLPAAGAVYMGSLFKFFKAKTCQSNIQDFIRSLNSKQTELLRDSKFMLILSQAYDNPEVLEKSKEFMEILTEQQIKKLSKIVNNHKANRKALIN